MRHARDFRVLGWLLTMTVLGCGQGSDQPEPTATVAEIEEQRIELTEAERQRLCATAWRADHDATLGYEGNALVDRDELKATAWRMCVSEPFEVRFEDGGILFDRGRGYHRVELPADGDEFARLVRIVDPDRFAWRLESGLWIVYRALEKDGAQGVEDDGEQAVIEAGERPSDASPSGVSE